MPLPEKALIAQIRRIANRRGASRLPALAGIGDDCAVLRMPTFRDSLVTTDFSLEGIHFRRQWHPPESVGHRCLCRGLSDIAAMGGVPVAAFLSLAIPRTLPQAWVEKFIRGLIKLAKKYDTTLAGGDTAESPNGVLADIVVIGTVPTGNAVLRSGARPGDRIYVTGELGGSAQAVSELMTHPKRKLNPKHYPRHFFPEPRVEVGTVLRETNTASAMIDISDGLSTDLAHICEESGVGAEVRSGTIPLAKTGKPPSQVDLQTALHGGEDYELLFTAPPGKRVSPYIAGVPVTQIGNITRHRDILLAEPSGARRKLEPRGWEHFRC